MTLVVSFRCSNLNESAKIQLLAKDGHYLTGMIELFILLAKSQTTVLYHAWCKFDTFCSIINNPHVQLSVYHILVICKHIMWFRTITCTCNPNTIHAAAKIDALNKWE